MFLLTHTILPLLGDTPLYLDPGSGSFLIQLLIAGFAGLSIALASQWKKVKKIFGKKDDGNNSEPFTDEEDDK